MLKLWTIYFQYGDHEEENEIFVHTDTPRPSTDDARHYLLKVFGGEGEYMDNPELLAVDGVYELTTAYDKDGNPYKVSVEA